MTAPQQRWLVLAFALVLLLLGTSAAARYFRPDPQLEKVRALRQDLMSEATRNLSSEERRERWQQFGAEMKQLSSDQRAELGQDRHQEYMKQLERYFTLPEKERMAHLDREIDRMEAMRKRWDAARAEKARNAGQPGSGSGAFGAPNPGSGSNGPRQPRTAEQKEQGRKAWLDRTEPEDRARMAEYRKQMEARRQQRGLPPSPWPGRR